MFYHFLFHSRGFQEIDKPPDSLALPNVHQHREEEKEQVTRHVEDPRPKMDLDKQPRLVDGGGPPQSSGAEERREEGGFVPLHITPL